jgi:hypothetical protein
MAKLQCQNVRDERINKAVAEHNKMAAIKTAEIILQLRL